jgi:type IV secretory pathway VirB2 component (pilin)
MVVLGIVALSIGFNLASLDFHRRAFVVLGIGAFGILCGLIGIIIIQVNSRIVSSSS